MWNAWSEEETLLQLAGHLRGRALEEWNLMEEGDRHDISKAKRLLRKRLDPGSKMLAAQDFRRASQQREEAVADYIRRLERAFRQAYGADGMSSETRDALLFGQMQEGLKFELMESPAVSGAVDYRQLCQAARNEEKRLIELEKRRRFLQLSGTRSQTFTTPKPTPYTHRPAVAPHQTITSHTQPSTPTPCPTSVGENSVPETSQRPGLGTEGRRCYRCNELGHLARDCKTPKPGDSVTERRWSSTQPNNRDQQSGSAKQVSSQTPCPSGCNQRSGPVSSLQEYLYSESSEEQPDILEVRIRDKGSRPQRVDVFLEGVPITGVVDSGADITIINESTLKRVAAAAKLGKSRLRGVDKEPVTYDGCPFTLHGRMDLDVGFEGLTMQTPVYIKLDAAEPLLLSEGVCRQLKILSYHPGVIGQREGHKTHVRSPTNDIAEADTATKRANEESGKAANAQTPIGDSPGDSGGKGSGVREATGQKKFLAKETLTKDRAEDGDAIGDNRGERDDSGLPGSHNTESTTHTG